VIAKKVRRRLIIAGQQLIKLTPDAERHIVRLPDSLKIDGATRLNLRNMPPV
jgi:hypothetical protein